MLTIAIAGNPNCGKTTLFNALTGSSQRIGNWPGVTVEKKEGFFTLQGEQVRLVDLPGIYALASSSEDERAAHEYLLAREADLVLNVIDASNLERNLYLTTQLMELGIPMVIAVNMLDVATRQQTVLALDQLAEGLHRTVVGITAVKPSTFAPLLKSLAKELETKVPAQNYVPYPDLVEQAIAHWASGLEQTAQQLNLEPRLAAIKFLENDQAIVEVAKDLGEINEDTRQFNRLHAEDLLGDAPEFVMGDARFGWIRTICQTVVQKGPPRRSLTDAIDAFVLHRLLGLPLFLLAMFLVFWVTVAGGNVFIDFFDIFFGTLFVDGSTALLQHLGLPAWVTAFVAGGLGTGLQTVSTFAPPIFFMFVMLALLEDSGYMARAAFVMDRFMSWLGLPGKAFVPMLVGFGCSVPAILGTRTLENRRDRLLTQFLIPFMSCGAKMPVYALFGAAFFGPDAPWMVFWIYFAGIALALLVGFALRGTLFRGRAVAFVMELPAYHVPSPRSVLRHAWIRLKDFLFKAGKVVLVMVAMLGFLNSMGTDGSFGNRDQENSLLSAAGKAITPIFEPMGVEKENWHASVALLSGLFAKEAVVGTLSSLYGQESDRHTQGQTEFSPWQGLKDAALSIVYNIGLRPAEEAGVQDADSSILQALRAHFTQGKLQAFAYLLFVLLYVPCLAAMGTAFREMGRLYGTVLAVFQTILGWSVATLFYQFTLGHDSHWVLVAACMIGALFAVLALMGRNPARS